MNTATLDPLDELNVLTCSRPELALNIHNEKLKGITDLQRIVRAKLQEMQITVDEEMLSSILHSAGNYMRYKGSTPDPLKQENRTKKILSIMSEEDFSSDDLIGR